MIFLGHDSGRVSDVDPVVVGTVLISVTLAYATLAALRHREPRGWNHGRTVSFVTAAVLLGLGWSLAGSDGFGDHMLGHLLTGMFAPLLLVMSAPVTLILRSVRPRTGRAIVTVLRSRPARVLTNPVALLTANLGGLVMLYFTPLYTTVTTSPVLHQMVHVHFFITGYLFAWMIAGPDPGPDRPPVHWRIVIVGITVLGHSILAQLIHAGLFVAVPASPQELRKAGTLMYYWGDIAEICLALSMLLTVRPVAPSRGTNPPGM